MYITKFLDKLLNLCFIWSMSHRTCQLLIFECLVHLFKFHKGNWVAAYKHKTIPYKQYQHIKHIRSSHTKKRMKTRGEEVKLMVHGVRII